MSDAVEIYNLGQYGIISDKQPHLLPTEAWSDGENIRFDENGVHLTRGHEQVFGTLQAVPEFLMSLPVLGGTYWFYFSLTEAWVVDGINHVNVTREDDSTDVPYTAAAGRNWNGTILGGIPIFNNGADIPQWWPTAASATPLADLPDWPSTLRAKVIRAFGPYLVAMNLLDSSTALPQAVRWSHKADPGTIPSSWALDDPNVDAGQTFLTDLQGGDIQEAGLLADNLIIYKENSTHALRFVGGNDIFSPQLLLSTSGILAPRCFCAFANGTRHLVLTQDDVIVHQGTREAESVVDEKNKKRIFNSLDPTNFVNSFVFHNEAEREVWIAYPEAGNQYPNIAAIWNYRFNTWTYREFHGFSADIGAFTAATLGVWDSLNQTWDSLDQVWDTESRRRLLFVDRAKAFMLDEGFLFDQQEIAAFVERRGIAIDGKDRQGQPKASISTHKLWHRLWPKLSGGPVTISIGVQQSAAQDAPIDWISEQFFVPGTDSYIDFQANGKLLAIRYSSLTDEPWTLSGHDLEVVKVSEL